jgi:large subunit ribosomal protein L22
MQFKAVAKGVHCSPYKLRPIVDVIRGKSAAYALAWCRTNKNRRMEPVLKVLGSAVANAHYLQQVAADQLLIKTIFVDQGQIRRYFKPGAQGRAMPQRKRMSHISIVLEQKQVKEARRGSKD